MKGGGKLTIETANAFLDEAYAVANPEVSPGQYVMIAITDTGRRANLAKRNELRDRIRMVFSSLSDEEVERIDSCLIELNSIIARLRIE